MSALGASAERLDLPGATTGEHHTAQPADPPGATTGEHHTAQPADMARAIAQLSAAHRACGALLGSHSQDEGLQQLAATFLELFTATLVVIDWFDPNEPVRGAAPSSRELGSWWAPWQNTAALEASSPLTVITVAPADRTGPLAQVQTMLVLELEAARQRGVLGVGFSDQRRFSEQELTLWSLLADHLALALTSAPAHDGLAQERASTIRARTTEELIGIAAHELRTPLTPITMLLQSVERKAKSGAADVDGITRTRRQVNRLARMISDLQDLSRLRRARLALNPEAVALRSTIEEAARAFQQNDPKNPLELAIPDEPLAVLFDRERLLQSLGAWLEHIARVIPSGQPIRLSAERRGLFVTIALYGGTSVNPLEPPSSSSHDPAKAASLSLAVHLADELVTHYDGSVAIDGISGERVTARLPLHDATPQE